MGHGLRAGRQDFSFLYAAAPRIQTRFKAHTASCTMGIECSFPWGKATVSWYSPLNFSSAEIKNTGAMNPLTHAF
jgi:hypothetical protein